MKKALLVIIFLLVTGTVSANEAAYKKMILGTWRFQNGSNIAFDLKFKNNNILQGIRYRSSLGEKVYQKASLSYSIEKNLLILYLDFDSEPHRRCIYRIIELTKNHIILQPLRFNYFPDVRGRSGNLFIASRYSKLKKTENIKKNTADLKKSQNKIYNFFK